MTLRIVTFCNADYIPVAQNWLCSLGRINMAEHAIIVSLDDQTRDAFHPDLVLHRPLNFQAEGLAALWSHRISVLREFLNAGEAVIHSDADAVWLRDPMHDIEACESPIVFSQGTYWPLDVHARRGLVVCCGFFYLRPVPYVFRFIEAVADRISADRDDQIAMNRVIDDWIEDWDIDDRYVIPFRNTHFVASREPIRAYDSIAQTDYPNISILPHHAYPRLLEEVSTETVVAHPLSGKTLKEKVDCLSRLGLWSL